MTANPQSAPILVLNIELGGAKQEIRVYPHDTAQQIAHSFCERNHLDARIEGKIVGYIERNVPDLCPLPRSAAIVGQTRQLTRNQPSNQGQTSLRDCVESLAKRCEDRPRKFSAAAPRADLETRTFSPKSSSMLEMR